MATSSRADADLRPKNEATLRAYSMQGLINIWHKPAKTPKGAYVQPHEPQTCGKWQVSAGAGMANKANTSRKVTKPYGPEKQHGSL